MFSWERERERDKTQDKPPDCRDLCWLPRTNLLIVGTYVGFPGQTSWLSGPMLASSDTHPLDGTHVGLPRHTSRWARHVSASLDTPPNGQDPCWLTRTHLSMGRTRIGFLGTCLPMGRTYSFECNWQHTIVWLKGMQKTTLIVLELTNRLLFVLNR